MDGFLVETQNGVTKIISVEALQEYLHVSLTCRAGPLLRSCSLFVSLQRRHHSWLFVLWVTMDNMRCARGMLLFRTCEGGSIFGRFLLITMCLFHKNEPLVFLTGVRIALFVQMPAKEVARKLGMCLTSLKKVCRQHGIKRWPYRRMKSIDKVKYGLDICPYH